MNEYQANLKLRRALDSGDLHELHEAFSMGVALDKWILNWNAPALSVALRHPTRCHILAKELLSRGADPHQTDKMGYTPFFWAWMGHTQAQDPEANEARLEAILLLKNMGVWQNQIQDAHHETHSLLHVAAMSNFSQGIQFLIQSGFSPKARNTLNQAPLHLTKRSPEAAGVLLAMGADPDELDGRQKVIFQDVDSMGPVFSESWNARCEASRMRTLLPEADSSEKLKVPGKRL